MDTTVVKIDQLWVIGYATKLTPLMVPTEVTPIFKYAKEPQSVVFPPFVISGDTINEATISTQHEFDMFVEAGQVTATRFPILAKANHTLWVGDNMDCCYEESVFARARLHVFAVEATSAALTALVHNNLLEAERESSVAISADDTMVDPLAIKAALRRHTGNETGYTVMLKMACGMCTPEYFSERVARITKRFSKHPVHKRISCE